MNDNDLPKLPPIISAPVPKPRSIAPSTERKMQALRLAKAMSDLHDKAHDRGAPETEGVASAQALAMTCLKHFDTIIWALRFAGGARRP